MALTREVLDSYRTRLQSDHARLLREIDESSKPQDFGGDVEGESMEEEADEGEAFANRLALAQSLKDRVNQIEDALNRIESGAYGACIQCGADISKETLDLAPESALCAACKKKEN